MSDDRNKVMKMSHINSQVSFREWLKANLIKENGSPLYKHDDVISNEHMLIFLNHIDGQIRDQMPEDHREWSSSLKRVRERLEKNE